MKKNNTDGNAEHVINELNAKEALERTIDNAQVILDMIASLEKPLGIKNGAELLLAVALALKKIIVMLSYGDKEIELGMSKQSCNVLMLDTETDNDEEKVCEA